jgi:hypothetical protein
VNLSYTKEFDLEPINSPKRRKIVTTIALLVTILGTIPSFAGTKDGGGGKGVVCLNPDKSIKSVELLDLWEARELYERKIPSSDAPVPDQIRAGIERIKYVIQYPYQRGQGGPGGMLSGAAAFAADLVDTARMFYEPNWGNVKRVRGIKLAPTNDSYEEASPTGDCKIRQLVRYKDLGIGGGPRILIAQDLVDRMNKTNQVALALHEALYTVMRKFGETTSVRVRRAVGYVMSGESFKSLETFVTGPHITCETNAPDTTSIPTRTRIHFVRRNGMNQAFPEVISESPFMGFEDPHSGEGSPSLEALYEHIQETTREGHGGWGMGFSLGASPVDFDSQVDFSAGLSGNKKIALTLTHSSSGVPVPQTIDLTCKYLTN